MAAYGSQGAMKLLAVGGQLRVRRSEMLFGRTGWGTVAFNWKDVTFLVGFDLIRWLGVSGPADVGTGGCCWREDPRLHGMNGINVVEESWPLIHGNQYGTPYKLEQSTCLESRHSSYCQPLWHTESQVSTSSGA